MSTISTDRASNLKWVARKGNTQTLTINFSTSVADREFTVFIRNVGGSTAVTLSEDNGKIVNNGTSIVVTLDGANADIRANTYQWELFDDTEFTWFCAPFVLNDTPYSGNTTTEVNVTIDVDGAEVDLEVTIATTSYRGVYATIVALQTAVPTGRPGDYADVDAGVGTDIQRYIWDDDDQEWILGGSPETVVGLQDLFIPASAMWPRTTGGCAALAKTEMTTSLFNIQSLDFDTTTQEFAQFQIALPRNWNNGTVTARVYWTAASGSGTVQWGISGGAYSNDDALTVAFGTAQTVDDTLIAANDLHLTDYTSAITLAGTPADADFLAFQISRNPSADTLGVDAKLLGITITLTTDAAVAA